MMSARNTPPLAGDTLANNLFNALPRAYHNYHNIDFFKNKILKIFVYLIADTILANFKQSVDVFIANQRLWQRKHVLSQRRRHRARRHRELTRLVELDRHLAFRRKRAQMTDRRVVERHWIARISLAQHRTQLFLLFAHFGQRAKHVFVVRRRFRYIARGTRDKRRHALSLTLQYTRQISTKQRRSRSSIRDSQLKLIFFKKILFK